VRFYRDFGFFSVWTSHKEQVISLQEDKDKTMQNKFYVGPPLKREGNCSENKMPGTRSVFVLNVSAIRVAGGGITQDKELHS
jgi:hypothetical protein